MSKIGRDGIGDLAFLFGFMEAWPGKSQRVGRLSGYRSFLLFLKFVFLVHADPSPAFWCIMSGLVSGWTTLYFISERVLSSLLRGGAVLAAVPSHWQTWDCRRWVGWYGMYEL